MYRSTEKRKSEESEKCIMKFFFDRRRQCCFGAHFMNDLKCNKFFKFILLRTRSLRRYFSELILRWKLLSRMCRVEAVRCFCNLTKLQLLQGKLKSNRLASLLLCIKLSDGRNLQKEIFLIYSRQLCGMKTKKYECI